LKCDIDFKVVSTIWKRYYNKSELENTQFIAKIIDGKLAEVKIVSIIFKLSF